MNGLVIGVDLGGSGIRALAAPLHGKHGQPVSGRGLGGPGNPWRSGPQAVAAHLLEALRACLEQAGEGPILACCMGMSGRSHPQSLSLAQSALQTVAPGARLELVDDLLIAHAAGFEERDGLLVLAGTGSGCLARRSGRVLLGGGLGLTHGDPASATRIRHEARQARLVDPQGDAPAAWLAAVDQASRTGCQAARDLLEAQARELASQACQVLVATGLAASGCEVRSAGGTLGHAPQLRAALKRALADHGLGLGPHIAEPVLGALWRARALVKDS